MDNFEKNKVYGNLIGKLTYSITCEFFYEAIFIEYAILEDRTSSLLKHSNKEYKEFTLSEKLYRIKHLDTLQNDYCKKHISKELLRNCTKWKNKRNELIHDLVERKYNDEEIKVIALEGYEIVKKFNSKTTLVNKFLDKNVGVNL